MTSASRPTPSWLLPCWSWPQSRHRPCERLSLMASSFARCALVRRWLFIVAA